MIDDQVILGIERLRDEVRAFESALRKRYKKAKQQVNAENIKATAAGIAERWMVDFAQRPEVATAVPSDYLADLNVHFQRLLTLSEQISKRSRYDAEIKAILSRFTTDLIIPLKQLRQQEMQPAPNVAAEAFVSAEHMVAAVYEPETNDFRPTAFVAHSFAPADKTVVNCVTRCLKEIGLKVETGEKPKANKISEKVKKLINGQYLFVGVFTRREKISRQSRWVTSPWLIDEKAYAVAKDKKLILLKEGGVNSIGGIQGDYEYIEFSRGRLQDLAISLLQMFDLTVSGLHS